MEIHKEYPCDPCHYQRGRTQSIKYLVIHYVGAAGGARDNAVYFHNDHDPAHQASAHYFVGHESEGAVVYQSVEERDTAWHCGAHAYRHPECRNANAIGIELCCHKDGAGKWYFDPITVARAEELARDVMARNHISPDHVVRHYDVTGKVCPAPFVEDEAAWRAFLDKLR